MIHIPIGRPSDYVTYRMGQVLDVQIKAACEQVACPSWSNGWETTVDERTPLGTAQAAYIRTKAGRTFRETRTDAGLTVFRFDSGQRCFADHHTTPELYSRTPGDRRAQTGPTFTHQTAADWVEDFGENQQKIADEIKRG